MDKAPEDIVGELGMDRSQFSIARLTDPDDSTEYWLTRPVLERLQALEHLRRTFYGQDITSQRLQRVLEVVKLEWR